jgi:transcriptional regulator with XRE-family HTH domain
MESVSATTNVFSDRAKHLCMARGPKAGRGVSQEMQRFSWLIQDLADDRGLSQREIAKIFDVRQSYISMALNLGRDTISAEILRHARQKLGVSADYFLERYEGRRRYTDYLIKEASPEARVSRLEEQMRLQAETVARLQKMLDEQPGPQRPESDIRRISSSRPPER